MLSSLCCRRCVKEQCSGGICCFDFVITLIIQRKNTFQVDLRMNSKKPTNKTKLSKCGHCNAEMLDQNLSKHCQEKHNSKKFVAGDTHITSYFGGQTRKHSSQSNELENTVENLLTEDNFVETQQIVDLNSVSGEGTDTVNQDHSVFTVV